MSVKPYPVRKLGDILTYRRRPITPQQDRRYDLIGVRWYAQGTHLHDTIEGAKLQAPTLWEVREGDIIYNKMWTSKGAFAVVSKENANLLGTSEYPTFEPSSQASADFLRYAFRQPRFWQLAEAWTNGTTERARLNPRDFLRLSLPLPSVAEQRAIAKVLDAAEEAIAKTEALILELENSRVELAREFLGLEQAPKWSIRSIGSLLRQCQYGLSIPLDGEGTIPVLRMPDVDAGRVNVDINKLKSTDVSPDEIAACAIRDGDILFNRTNSQALVGKTGIVRKSPSKPIVFASYLIRLVTQEVINPFWLNAVLNLPRTQQRLKTLATPGVSQWNINASTLKRFSLPVPPKADQDRFAELYEAIENRLEAERAKLKAMGDTRVALAQELISGRLRLPENVIARHHEQPGQAA